MLNIIYAFYVQLKCTPTTSCEQLVLIPEMQFAFQITFC